MKQRFYFKSLLIALFVLFGGGIVFAEEETIVFSEKGYDNGELVSIVDGTNIRIVFTKDNANNAPAYYTTGNAVRVYGGGYFTVTANGKYITNVEFVFGSGDGSNEITTGVGTYSNGIWTGYENSIKFTIGGTSGHRRIASIKITYSTETPAGKDDPQNSFAVDEDNAIIGEDYTMPTFTSSSDGAKTYSSSNTDVATINNSGVITLLKAGKTTITVKTAQTATYAEGYASYTLIVSKGTPVLSFASETFTIYLGTDKYGPELTNPSDIDVTYEISNPDIATIQSNGYIQPKTKGTAIVTVTPADTDAWNSVQASYTLIVEDAFHVDAEGTYEWVKDASLLKDGDQILISYIESSSVGKVLGLRQNNNFKATGLIFGHISDDKGTFTIDGEENVTAAILEGSDGAWYFHTNEGYLCATGSNKNYYLKTTQQINDNAKATISIEENGNAAVVFQGTNANKYLRYNSGSALFSCYGRTNNMKLIQIYRKTNKQPKPTVSFEKAVVEITYGDNYDKQQATVEEGYSGKLKYTSNNEEVVKFHGNNVIDVLGPGTVTITATAPATETTEESSATYTLKIYEPADESEALDEDFSKCNGTNSQFGGSSGFIAVPDGLGWETSNCHAGAGYLKIGTSSVGVATSPAFSVNGEVPLSFAIAPWIANNDTEGTIVIVSLENAEFGNGKSTLELDIKDLAQGKFTIFDQYTIVGNSAAVRISFSATNAITGHRYFLDNVVVGGGAHEINLKFSSAGYLTWVATADIDFAHTAGVTAYKITEATPKKITMVKVDKVKTGEAVMLQGSGTVPLTRTTGVEAFTDNKMLPCTDGSVTGNGVGGVTNTDVYVLGNGKNGLGFYMLKGTLQAGKGYLQVSESAGSAKQNFIAFEETTGVKAIEVNGNADNAIYNLQGVRVANPQKGIYVKNGKKYVIK